MLVMVLTSFLKPYLTLRSVSKILIREFIFTYEFQPSKMLNLCGSRRKIYDRFFL